MKWFLLGCGLILLCALYYRQHPRVTASSNCMNVPITLPNGDQLPSEIAGTPAQREEGLSDRDSLPPRTGMLFLFPSTGAYPFWMKDTRIPLDIIWLQDKQVVEIAQLEPQRGNDIPLHTPTHTANAVLELNQGEAASLSLHEGTKLSWPECPSF